jgi:cyclopropane-fatty-acyl-phospholipid synthase
MRETAASALTPLARQISEAVPGGLPLGVRLWDGSEVPGPAGAPRLVVKSPKAVAYAVHAPGEVGLGRAWVAGQLDVEGDLEATLERVERFRDLRFGFSQRLAALRAARRLGGLSLRAPAPPAAEARVRGRLHSRRRDRVAVRHHYDVSNRFFRLVLGPTMVYSCAYFGSPDDTLEEAQERKLDVICRKLALEPGQRLLDVGCGWGSLIVHAAARYGVRAVGVTLSEPQAELARERARAAGVADRCEVRVQDYRDVDDGPYDRVASVGMYEHVGRGRLDEYAGHLRGLLRAGGLLLNHGIVRLAPRGRERPSFISRFVFPDSYLHPVAAVVGALEAAGLEVRDLESLREHYALTLRRWTANLAANRPEVIAEAGEERERVWRLYMTASALAFERGEISVCQVLTAAPEAPHRLPLARPAHARELEAAR